MKDRAFTGRDVAEAIRIASETLGVPESRLRYFVLDAGRPGTLGVAPSPATIAVLMGAAAAVAPPPPSRPPTPSRDEGRGREDRLAPAPDLLEGEDFEDEEFEPLGDRLARVTAALGEALGVAVNGEVDEGRDAATIRLTLAEPGFLGGPDGQGAPARALEHLLHRMFAYEVAPRKLRVELTGFREMREEALKDLTLRLAAEVRRLQGPKATPPLNAYERRIVHLTAASAGGVVTRSEGEGADRRVVLEPAVDAGPGGEVF